MRQDGRLAVAAALTWGCCWLALIMPATLTWGLVLALLLAALVCVRRLRRIHAASARGRHRVRPEQSVTAVVLMSVLISGALVGTVAVRVEGRATVVGQWDGRTAEVRVLAVKEPAPMHTRPGVRFPAQALTFDGVPADLPVLVLAPPEWADLLIGTELHFEGRLAETSQGDQHALLVFPTGEFEHGPPRGWWAVVANLRSGLVQASVDLPPAARGLVPGIALGDDRALPPEVEQAMRETSLTHLTAVSGAHVALVLGVVLVLFGWAPRSVRVGVGALVLVAFVLLVRPDGSVLRSAVMGGVLLVGLLLRRPRAALPALCAAVIILLGVDPWMARSYGFALSVVATGGLLVGTGPLAAWLGQWFSKPLAWAIAVPVAAQVACTPVLSLLDPELPFYAVPANLLAGPAVAPATILGLAATLAAPFTPGGAAHLAQIASWLTAWVASVALTFATFPAPRVTVVAALGATMPLAVFAAIWHRRRSIRCRVRRS